MLGRRAKRPSPGTISVASSCCGRATPRAKSTWPNGGRGRSDCKPAERTQATRARPVRDDRHAEPPGRLRQILEGPAAAQLDASRDDFRARLAGIEEEIHQRMEKRGQIAAQMKSMAARIASWRGAAARLASSNSGSRGHRSLASSGGHRTGLGGDPGLLRNRSQPETLQEDLRYFSQMTQGRYRRVWTPVGKQYLTSRILKGMVCRWNI